MAPEIPCFLMRTLEFCHCWVNREAGIFQWKLLELALTVPVGLGAPTAFWEWLCVSLTYSHTK